MISFTSSRLSLLNLSLTYTIIPEADPAQKPMYEYKRQASQRSRQERACTHDNPAKDRSQHNYDDIVESRPLAECPDAGYTNERQCQEECKKFKALGKMSPKEALRLIEA